MKFTVPLQSRLNYLMHEVSTLNEYAKQSVRVNETADYIKTSWTVYSTLNTMKIRLPGVNARSRRKGRPIKVRRAEEGKEPRKERTGSVVVALQLNFKDILFWCDRYESCKSNAVKLVYVIFLADASSLCSVSKETTDK